jgi:hypothetical protein
VTLYGVVRRSEDGSASLASVSPIAHCPACRYGFPISHELFVHHFQGTLSQCPRVECGVEFDWWKSMIDSLILMSRSGTSNAASNTIGTTTMARVSMAVGGVTEVRLADYAVPPTALVLEIANVPVVLPGGHVEILPWGTRHRLRWSIPHVVDLYAAGLGIRAGTAVEVDIRAHWVDVDSAPDAMVAMAQAVVAFGERFYDCIPLPANTTVELSVTRLLTERGRDAGISKSQVDKHNLAEKLATLLPLLAERLGAPKLPNEVVAGLVELRRLRNDVGHQGQPKQPVEPGEAAKCLAAAIFSYEYFSMLRTTTLGSKHGAAHPPTAR